MADRKDWDQSQLRKYDIQLDEIPRLNAKDPRVDEFIAENVSILIKQSVNIISFWAAVLTTCQNIS
jgi:hypothetical protein